jgi:hypothetical protein
MADDGSGRPAITEEQKKQILSAIEPYLKSGLSITKAIKEATNISRATFYNLLHDDQDFADKVEQFRQFTSVIFNGVIMKQLRKIIERQNKTVKDANGNEVEVELNGADIEFLKWFALNSNLTRGEFGARQEVTPYDPELEIKKLNDAIKEITNAREKNGTDK